MTKETAVFTSNNSTYVSNFAINNLESSVQVHDRWCGGCKSVGSDLMLTFGSYIDILDGNNIQIQTEGPKHVDVFINTQQAEGLIEKLQKAIKRNKGGEWHIE